jgi:hypothetical protein
MAQGFDAEEFRRDMRLHGEPVRWFRAIPKTGAAGHDPATGSYGRNSGADSNDIDYVEQELDPAVRVLVYQAQASAPDAEYGNVPTGATEMSYMPDELQPHTLDRLVLPKRRLVKRDILTRSGAGLLDALPASGPAVQIQLVMQGNTEGAAVYPGTAYQLTGDSIEWKVATVAGVTRPAAGSTYVVEWLYSPGYLARGDGERFYALDDNDVPLPQQIALTQGTPN